MLFSLSFLLVIVASIIMVCGAIAFGIVMISKRAGGIESRVPGEPETEGNRRAKEIVSKQSTNVSAYKCQKCGATVDSTAEISADSKVRCNYCNAWTSIL